MLFPNSASSFPCLYQAWVLQLATTTSLDRCLGPTEAHLFAAHPPSEKDQNPSIVTRPGLTLHPNPCATQLPFLSCPTLPKSVPLCPWSPILLPHGCRYRSVARHPHTLWEREPASPGSRLNSLGHLPLHPYCEHPMVLSRTFYHRPLLQP